MGRCEKHLWPHDDQSKCDRLGIEKEKEGTNRTWIYTLWRDGERLKDGLSSLGFRRWMDRRLNRIKRNRLRRKRSGFVEIACVPWKRRSRKGRGKREEETVGFIHHHPASLHHLLRLQRRNSPLVLDGFHPWLPLPPPPPPPSLSARSLWSHNNGGAMLYSFLERRNPRTDGRRTRWRGKQHDMERQKRGWGGATKDLSDSREMFSLRVDSALDRWAGCVGLVVYAFWHMTWLG